MYDPRNLSAANATIRLRNLIRTVAARHKSNNPNAASAWGAGWQTALWAYYDGVAAWLMWDELSTQDRQNVVDMLVAESNRLTTGDDVHLGNPAVVNGIKLSKWLQGTNIEDDGILRNHNRIHPLYMVSFDQNLYQGAISALGRSCAPAAALHNLPRVYEALVDRPFDGTTIYTPGSAAIHYPEGNDWGAEFPFYFGNFDLLVSLYRQDGRASTTADVWERLHNERQLDMQARFADGRTYLDDSENNYYGREQRVGVMAGQAFLSLWMTRNEHGAKVCWRR